MFAAGKICGRGPSVVQDSSWGSFWGSFGGSFGGRDVSYLGTERSTEQGDNIGTFKVGTLTARHNLIITHSLTDQGAVDPPSAINQLQFKWLAGLIHAG